jgi:DNA recombination protein RmuC
MDTEKVILIAATAFACGALIGWLVGKSRWAVKYAVLKSNFEILQEKLEQQKVFIENSEKAMKEAFGSLAADALNLSSQQLVMLAESKLNEKVSEVKGALETKEKAMDGLVKPLAESLGKMDHKIQELEVRREHAYSNIHTVLEVMQKTAQALDKGTQSLATALKNSGTRGKYGEIGLRRVVEYAGMLEHCDFEEQRSIQSEEGLLRPDMTIHLPERKIIVVDSKTPLDAYMKAFETENDSEQKMFMNQHAKAVREHLKKLAAKAYWNQFKESPDYVILYMQIESSFAAALQADPTLIEEGIRNNIILATPTTLITLLRTVGFVWQQRSVAENIEQIRDAGIELYNRTTVLLKHFASIGASLEGAVSYYNSAVSSMESRFIPQAKKLYQLGAAYTRNTLPATEQIQIPVRPLEAGEKLMEAPSN